MMPLTYAQKNEENIIKKVGGNTETKHHLENLGFVQGTAITVVNDMNGNLICNIKGARVALSKELANKIMV